MCYGGPAGRPPGSWGWAVYAGPSPALRRFALELVDTDTLATWSVSRQTRAPHTAWLGIQTVRGYYVLGFDHVGPYLMGHCGSEVADGAPAQTVYRAITGTVHRLRDAAAFDTHTPPRTSHLRASVAHGRNLISELNGGSRLHV